MWKKGVDKGEVVWYSNQAVRESGECKWRNKEVWKNSKIVLDKPITHFNDILDIANTLSKNNILAEKCTILNFQLLRVENENE